MYPICPQPFFNLFTRFEKPDDGLPVIADWVQTAESMLFGGIDLGREPIDVSSQCQGWTLKQSNMFGAVAK